MAGAVGKSSESVGRDGKTSTETLRKGIAEEATERACENDGEIPPGTIESSMATADLSPPLIGECGVLLESPPNARGLHQITFEILRIFSARIGGSAKSFFVRSWSYEITRFCPDKFLAIGCRWSKTCPQ
jgi:hypothetical protein